MSLGRAKHPPKLDKYLETWCPEKVVQTDEDKAVEVAELEDLFDDVGL